VYYNHFAYKKVLALPEAKQVIRKLMILVLLEAPEISDPLNDGVIHKINTVMTPNFDFGGSKHDIM
jgi:Tfp pilus assembly ATPase PilU